VLSFVDEVPEVVLSVPAELHAAKSVAATTKTSMLEDFSMVLNFMISELEKKQITQAGHRS
jgi:hypothetical protein